MGKSKSEGRRSTPHRSGSRLVLRLICKKERPPYSGKLRQSCSVTIWRSRMENAKSCRMEKPRNPSQDYGVWISFIWPAMSRPVFWPRQHFSCPPLLKESKFTYYVHLPHFGALYREKCYNSSRSVMDLLNLINKIWQNQALSTQQKNENLRVRQKYRTLSILQIYSPHHKRFSYIPASQGQPSASFVCCLCGCWSLSGNSRCSPHAIPAPGAFHR